MVELAELVFSKVSRRPVRWVLAVPNDSPIQGPKDLQGKRIATEVVNITRKWLASHGVTANVEFSWGATEVKPPKLADAIVEVTETGSSLKANNLRIVCDILTSTTRFVANPAAAADPWKRQKMDDLILMLKGAMAAEGKVGLMMNVRKGGPGARDRAAARAEEPDDLVAGGPGVGGGEHDHRRGHGAAHHPATEGGRRQRDRRVPADEDHRLAIRGGLLSPRAGRTPASGDSSFNAGAS